MGNKSQYISRERKKEKKNNNFDNNGKYSSKHVKIQIDNKEKYNKNKLNNNTENNELQKKHHNK
jgi:hypothetical protein